MEKKSIKLGKIIEDFSLEVLHGAENYLNCPIHAADINRPALPLLGFFDYYDHTRLQVIGKVELTYLEGLTTEERRRSYEGLFSRAIPALIISRGLEPTPECLEMAIKYDRTLLRTKDPTSIFIPSLLSNLNAKLCPRITRHGVLVDVYGEGILLMGESGVGKSETAIELVKRGHRLVADDAVEIRNIDSRLIGSAPELIRHYIELRGIGVVDVLQLFGMSAVRDEQDIDLIVNLEQWNENVFYDRLGTNEEFTTILDKKVPVNTIPVKPGRNLAIIVEVAAMNNRHKKMGHNAAVEFTKQLDAHFEQMLSAQGGEQEEDETKKP
ncbi:MAG: HPr(Ser) kinase/phosphatase [Evtepia sp.]